MPSVFDTTKCDLPSIPAIGDFAFIADCTVPSAPPPIYECPDIDFELPIAGPAGPIGPPGPAGAPGADGACPSIAVSLATSLAYNKKIPRPKITSKLIKKQNSSFPCQNSLSLSIGLSLPCPDVDFGGSLTYDRTVVRPKFDVIRTDKYPDTDQCGDNISLALSLPCPDIGFSATLEYSKKADVPAIRISTENKYPDTDQCGELVSIGLSLPCPEVEFAGDLKFGKSVTTAKFEVTKTEKYPDTDQCGDNVSLALSLPCADVDFEAQVKQNKAVNQAKVTTLKTPKYPDTDQCGDNVSFGFSLPCADINFDTSLTVLPAGTQPTLELDVTDKYPDTDQCGTVLNFKFGLPSATAWCSGNGAPSVETCNDGDYYLDLLTGNVYIKVNGAWTGPVTNLKGEDGESTTLPCCPATTYASIVTGVYCQGNQLIVQYQT